MENEINFKAGDRVRVINNCSGSLAGQEYALLLSSGGSLYAGDGVLDYVHGSGCSCQSNWIPISLKDKNNMNNKETFVLALTSEPKKSFRKAGITNGDDLLTEDGEKVFLTWLLHSKFAEEFKKDVVDGLLKEQEEVKK
jgi:hypothetical protein